MVPGWGTRGGKKGFKAYAPALLMHFRFIRQRPGQRVHFWPFDGWDIPASRSAVVEVYPALWSRSFAREERNGDQHDAYSIAARLRRSDLDKPALTPSECALAQVEGWILGVA